MQFKEQKEAVELKVTCHHCQLSVSLCQCGAEQQDDATASEPAVPPHPVETDVDQLFPEGVERDPMEGREYIGGRYKILDRLGRGGMGTVYKVKHEALDKIFAVKILNRDVTTQVQTIRRFDQEAKAIGKMEHENVLGVHDYGATDDGIPYLVMDYLDGVELSEEIKKLVHIDEQRALHIFEKVANGLSYAHSNGIIHRDLKPSNIMIVKDANGIEVPKIVDFGIAKRQMVDSKLTQTGEIFGTPLYMSPEQCMGNPVDARSDIYSFGCMMYEALSGKPPLAGENAVKTIFRHLNEDAPLLRKNCSQTVSAGLEQVVARCLEKNPDHRPQSAEALAIDLRRIAAGQQPEKARLHRVKRSPLIPILSIASSVGLVSVLLVATLFWYCTSSLSSRPSMRVTTQAERMTAIGKFKEAAALSEKAASLAENEKLTPSQLLPYYQQLVECYAHLSDYEKAAAACRKVIAFTENSKAFPEIQVTYAWRAAEYEDYVNPEKALKDYAVAVASRERLVGPDSPSLVSALLTAGSKYFNRQQYTEAGKYLEQAQHICDKNESVSPSLKYDTYAWASHNYIKTGQRAQAIEALKKARKYAEISGVSPERQEALARSQHHYENNGTDLSKYYKIKE